jgi:hypothetical protein
MILEWVVVQLLVLIELIEVYVTLKEELEQHDVEFKWDEFLEL